MTGRARTFRHGENHRRGGADPIPGLTVDGIEFNKDNQGGWLDVQTNDADADGYGIHINDDTGENGILVEAEQAIKITTQDGAVYVLLRDSEGGMTLHSADRVFVDASSFEIDAGTTIDGGGNVAENFDDGSNPTDLATIGQLAAAIRYAVANSGDYLEIETTDVSGAGCGVYIHDTDATSNGIDIESDAGAVTIYANAAQVDLTSGGALVRVSGGDVLVQLAAGKTFTVIDSGSNPLFRVDEDGDLHGKTGKALTFDL